MAEHSSLRRADTLALEPRSAAAPAHRARRHGALECVDSSGAQVQPGMTVAEFLTIDRGRIHALTGPIFVDGAEPGDVLQIDVLEVAHKGWGWSSVIAGLGFLKQRFHRALSFSLAARRRDQPIARACGGAAAAVLRRDGRCSGGGRRVSHAAPGNFRRQHGRARAVAAAPLCICRC